MSLRRSLIASSLILAPITTFGFGSAAFADTATDIALAKAIRTQELKHDPSRYAKNQIG